MQTDRECSIIISSYPVTQNFEKSFFLSEKAVSSTTEAVGLGEGKEQKENKRKTFFSHWDKIFKN
jgi:hypothetical protein